MVITFIFIVFIVTGLTLNIVTIVAFAKNRFLLTPTDLPVLSIAIADAVLIILALPLGAVRNALGAWPFGFIGCSWYACLNAIVGLGTMLHHAILAAEKCWKIHWPMATEITRKTMCMIFGVVWGFVMLCEIFPFFGWSSYGPEGNGATCSVKWQTDDPGDISYIICLFVFFFIFPVAVIVTSYVTIYRDLLNMAERAKQKWGRKARQTAEALLARKKVVFTAFILMASFFAAWTPYAAVSFYSAFFNPEHISPLAATIPSILAKSSLLFNPIVYFFRYKKFRKGVFHLFKTKNNRPPSAFQDINCTMETPV